MNSRDITRIIPGLPASDGAGVKLTRSLGGRPGLYLDPFLMLDEFASDEAADYIGGFPPHPHRGFETVTYMLDGRMRHEDHLGNRGDLGPGDVQWMTAGRGIVHSEMPQQTAGRMRGFQLWINLPAAEKMRPADYRDIPAAEIPRRPLPSGGEIAVIAGEIPLAGESLLGPGGGGATEALYLDVTLAPHESVRLPLPPEHAALVYVYEGEVDIGDRRASARQVAVLGEGDGVALASEGGARLLLLAGRPLREPVVQYGPFVMNSREEIEQALKDYAEGRLTAN